MDKYSDTGAGGRSKLLLFGLLGIAAVAVAVLAVRYVLDQSTPENRARAVFEKLGGTRYHLKLDGDSDGADLAEIAATLHTRLLDLGIEHARVELADGRIVASIPADYEPLDSRLLTRPGQLHFHIAPPDFQAHASGEPAIVPGAQLFPYRDDPHQQLLTWAEPEIQGRELDLAYATMESGRWQLVLKLKAEGARRFYELSREHEIRTGSGLPLAIILDGEILSAPVFNEPIAGGTAVISGDFTELEARSIASSMMTPIPVPLTILSMEELPPAD